MNDIGKHTFMGLLYFYGEDPLVNVSTLSTKSWVSLQVIQEFGVLDVDNYTSYQLTSNHSSKNLRHVPQSQFLKSLLTEISEIKPYTTHYKEAV